MVQAPPFEFLSEEWKNHAPSNDAVSDLLNDIVCFFRERGNSWPVSPKSSLPMKVGLYPLETILPHMFFEVFEKRGGYDRVCAEGSWTEVRKAIRVTKIPMSSTHLLQFVYKNIVLPYEREREHRNLERNEEEISKLLHRPLDLIGYLIRFTLPITVDDQKKSVQFWGRVRSYDELVMEHECLMDDGRIIRTVVRDADAAFGRHVATPNPTIQAGGDIYRFLPLEGKLIKLESPKQWTMFYKRRRKPDARDKERKVDRRVEITSCACGWQREVGKMLKCSICR
mmetsp:Transcript_11901/g.36268  ORF Transcript_11901/g.36268 Transcript_11901/m.36268 type:complete len:283 (+) Transcript_11901:238-1086(+)